MDVNSRYRTEHGVLKVGAVLRDAAIAAVAGILLLAFWPIRTVPTGTRGVITALAEAEATALKAKADGEAYANLKVATAQAEALKIQNAALAQNRDVLELRRIEVERVKAERWNGALPTSIYAGAPIPFFTPPGVAAK